MAGRPGKRAVPRKRLKRELARVLGVIETCGVVGITAVVRIRASGDPFQENGRRERDAERLDRRRACARELARLQKEPARVNGGGNDERERIAGGDREIAVRGRVYARLRIDAVRSL